MIKLKIEDPDSGRKTIMRMKLGRNYSQSATAIYYIGGTRVEKRICALQLTVLDIDLTLDDIITALQELKHRMS